MKITRPNVFTRTLKFRRLLGLCLWVTPVMGLAHPGHHSGAAEISHCLAGPLYILMGALVLAGFWGFSKKKIV